MIDEKWNLENLPPCGNKDVPRFAYNLFKIAETEKIRLKKNEDMLSNYSLYRGKTAAGIPVKNKNPVNLYFSNIERTVANITARNPTGEVVDMDGIGDDGEKVMSAWLLEWWKNTNQKEKTKSSARGMEIYGCTVEKPVWEKTKHRPNINIADPFSFFPAPGKYDEIDTKLPFAAFVYLKRIDAIEKEYGVKDVSEESAYSLLGAIREEYQADVPDQYAETTSGAEKTEKAEELKQCLKIEVWMRDKSTKKVLVEAETMDEMGRPVMGQVEKTVPVYPDGVRVVTIVQTDKGYIVLEDCANPNINSEVPTELTSKTHPWGRFPMYHAVSYDDLVTIWGFAASEQVGDLIVYINKIVIKLIAYVLNVMSPPLIVQKHCGISRNEIEACIEQGGRLLLMPNTPNARIEFMQIPNLPSTFFQVLDLIVRFFDRIYAMEEADRGEAPRGVIAAKAIQALQERNQVLMQPKTSSVESLAENRSRWAIGLLQNFGFMPESVEVADEQRQFTGSDFIGRQFGYVVEVGSSMPKTGLMVQEMAPELFKMNALDRRALLESINWPGWQAVIERTSENMVDQALQVLIESGLPEDQAAKLREYVMQSGQGIAGSKTKEGNKTTEPRHTV